MPAPRIPLSVWHSRLLEFRAVFQSGARLQPKESKRLVELVDSCLGDLAERAKAQAEREGAR